MTGKRLPENVKRLGELYVLANFAEASSVLRYAFTREDVDAGAWWYSPFQVADAKHRPSKAQKLLEEWRGKQ